MIRKLVLMGVVLAAMLTITVIIVPYYIHDNVFRWRIISKVQETANLHMKIAGRIRVRLLPYPVIKMENVRFFNMPAYYSAQPLITSRFVEADIAFFPLLLGRVEVSSVYIDKPQITLYELGNANIAQSVKAIKSHSFNEVGGVNGRIPFFWKAPYKFLFSDIRLKDGTIVYHDKENKMQWRADKLDADIVLDGMDSPFTLDASYEWNGKPVTAKAEIGPIANFFNELPVRISANAGNELFSLTTKGIDDGIKYTGTVQAKSPSLKTFLSWFSPQTPPIQAPEASALDMSGDTDCTPFNNCSLTNASLTFGDMQAKGDIKIGQGEMVGSPPKIDVKLITGIINLDTLFSMPPAEPPVNETDTKTHERWNGKPIDFSILHSINGEVAIASEGIVLHETTFGRTSLSANLRDGHLVANITNGDSHGRQSNITINMDGSIPVPTIESNVIFKGIEIKLPFKDIADADDIHGAADAALNIVTKGKSEKDFITALAGKGQFKAANAILESASDAEKTPVSDVHGTFSIDKGIISNHDLAMTLPTLRICGQGEINLPAYSIHYLLTPQMTKVSKQGDKTNGNIPVVVEGSLDNPAFHPDIKAVARDALKNPKN